MSRREAIVVLLGCFVFLTTLVSPPSLMDDVDSTYAQIARTMLETGDYVTAHLNGVKYFDKPPGQVWVIAASYAVFGVHDWAARVPLALACVLLAWVTFRLGRWAFSEESGFWAGVVMASSVGMWLFSRVRIADPYLTLWIVIALGCALHLLEEPPRRRFAILFGGSLGAGLIFKGLPALVFPGGALLLYALWQRDFAIFKRLIPFTTCTAFLVVALPWHVLATLRNPPLFEWTLQSQLGIYRGFFWRYFINEHVLRYLGLRYPKDYNTTPQWLYWCGHFIWLFPWSSFFPATVKLQFSSDDRAGRVRRLCLCWLGFVLMFFALSTSQEYYTMPAYPAIALLLGDGIARGGVWVARGARIAAAVSALAGASCVVLLAWTWNVSPSGDIAQSLSSNPDAYTLSLGHMKDLTLKSFAWLRGPLVLAALAFGLGAVSGLRRWVIGLALMMALFFQAARWAMVSFDPYLSSRALAEAYQEAPPGKLVLDDQYYSFSSVVFYTNQPVLLLNGRVNNIEYGSNAPDAPDVFLDDAAFRRLWESEERVYLATFEERVDELPIGRVVVGAGGEGAAGEPVRGEMSGPLDPARKQGAIAVDATCGGGGIRARSRDRIRTATPRPIRHSPPGCRCLPRWRGRLGRRTRPGGSGREWSAWGCHWGQSPTARR